jgi:hypothetical protein
MEIRELLAQAHNDLSNGASFVSAKDASAQKRATGDNAFWAVNLGESTYDETDLKVADEALAWVRDYKGDNAFMKSLVRVAAFDTVHMGQADRAVWILQKYLGREATLSGLPSGFGAQSTHVGAVKEEIFKRANVAQVRLFKNRYQGPGPNGERQVVTLIDKDGNVYVYFPSSKILPLSEGQSVRFRAIVKGHTEYNGVLQTAITRATIIPA